MIENKWSGRKREHMCVVLGEIFAREKKRLVKAYRPRGGLG
jgi:hypothetical protein